MLHGEQEMRIRYFSYTKTLHVGDYLLIGLGGYSNWSLIYYSRPNLHYIRIGKLGIAYYTKPLERNIS
jgi:hypothetical protein